MCSVEGEEDGGEKYEGKNVVDVSVVKGGGGEDGGGERKGTERVWLELAVPFYMYVINEKAEPNI